MINNNLHDIFKKELQGKLSPDPGTRKCTIKNKKQKERERDL